MMRMNAMPLVKADSVDDFFTLLRANRNKTFWKMQRSLAQTDASKEFMDLVSSMINPDARMRPELTDIIVSPFMKG